MQADLQLPRWEEWAFRFFGAGVLAIAFSIGLGQGLLSVSFLLTAYWVLKAKRRPRPGLLAGIVLVFVLLAVLTAAYGANPSKGVSKLPRLGWWLTIPTAFLLVRNSNRLLLLLRLFTIGCCVLAAEICVVRPVLALQRGDAAGSFVSQMIDMGSMTDGQMLMLGLLAAAALVTVRVRQGETARWEWAALALVLLGLLLNFKRGSWGCAMIVLGVYLVRYLKKRGLALVAAVVVVAILMPPVRQRLASIREQFDVMSGSRATMWMHVAPEMIRQHPWGVGYGAVSHDMMREYSWRIEPGRDHLHSNVLQVLVETGWLGLAVYLLWMTKAVLDGFGFVRLAPAASPVEQAGAFCLVLMLCGLLLNGIVEYNFGDTEILVLYGVVMGAAAAGRLRSARAGALRTWSSGRNIFRSAGPV